MPAESQEVVNRIMRHTGRVTMKNYDQAGRQALQDDFDVMRGKRPRSKVAEAASSATREGDSGIAPGLDKLAAEDSMRDCEKVKREGKATAADVGADAPQTQTEPPALKAYKKAQERKGQP